MLWTGYDLSSKLTKFIGSVCRTETMHQLHCSKGKFLNYFAFTLGR